MNYLESKVKELFEQVLKGEKRVPEVSGGEEWVDRFGRNYICDVLRFSRNLIIQLRRDGKLADNSILVMIGGEYNVLCNNIELVELFQKVFECCEKVKFDKDSIDKIFGELE